jgi:phosphotransferase system enzyme I (PtsI)
MEESNVLVLIREGLHARPAAYLAKLAKGFPCRVEMVAGGTRADAKSSVKIMLLSVKEGDEILLRADGEGEVAALARMKAYLQDPLGGLEAAEATPAVAVPAVIVPAAPPGPSAPPEPAGGRIQGVAGSAGLAFGPVRAYFPPQLHAKRLTISAAEVGAELRRFRAALDSVVASARGLAGAAATVADDRSIVEAIVDVAQDDAFVSPILEGIERGGDAAAVALAAGEALAARFAGATTEYLRARAEDVRGVTRQVAAALLGEALPDLSALQVKSVLVARDLSALEFAGLPLANVLGLVCTEGSATSHVAIMARTHGIPAVMGVRIDAETIQRARWVAVDGDAGTIVLDPDDAERARLQVRIDAASRAKAELLRYREHLPRTIKGREIHVAANLGALNEIPLALEAGAMGVGLFRTELMFMQKGRLLTENEQAEAYHALASAFHPRSVVIRTLDVGGDKPLAGIEFPAEENPFLGWRGVRMCLDRPDVFKPQLRALLRAAAVGNVRVMVPMVSVLDEVTRVRALIRECEAELKTEGTAFGTFELGIMIETPAAALHADVLAREVSFFSIGTNDLTQYVMATDRANARIASLYRTEHPAVMTAIRMTCEAAQRAGIWVSICGEAAANHDLAPRFIEMGVTELSMSPAAILSMKKRISEL